MNKIFKNKLVGIALVAVAFGVFAAPVALADQYTTAALSAPVTTNNSNTTVWFEYGPTASLGYTTPSQTFPASSVSSTYSYTLTNLSPNTTYYYRAAASNLGGTTRGSIYNFSTNNGSVSTNSNSNTIVTNSVDTSGLAAMLASLRGLLSTLSTTTSTTANVTSTNVNVASANYPAILHLTSDKNSVGNGDEVNLTATVTPASRINNATLKFFLDSSLTFESVSVNNYTKDANTITVPLGTLNPISGDTSVTVRAKVANLENSGKISPAVALYYTQNGVAGTPVTATLDINTNSNNFGANILSAFGNGVFLISLLAIIIIGLGAVLFVKFVLK